MNDIISIPNLKRSEPYEVIDPAVRDLIRKFHVSAMLLDDPDSNGDCQLQIFSDDEQILKSMADDVASKNEPE